MDEIFQTIFLLKKEFFFQTAAFPISSSSDAPKKEAKGMQRTRSTQLQIHMKQNRKAEIENIWEYNGIDLIVFVSGETAKYNRKLRDQSFTDDSTTSTRLRETTGSLRASRLDV